MMVRKWLLMLPLLLLFGIAILCFFLINKAPFNHTEGEALPDFQAYSLIDHSLISRQTLPSHPFVLNVWASWCSWCIQEFPVLMRLKQKGITIVGITHFDDPEKAKQALEKWGNPFDLIIDDRGNKLAQKLNIHSIPVSYIIDETGHILYFQEGYSPDFEQQALDLLTR